MTENTVSLNSFADVHQNELMLPAIIINKSSEYHALKNAINSLSLFINVTSHKDRLKFIGLSKTILDDIKHIKDDTFDIYPLYNENNTIEKNILTWTILSDVSFSVEFNGNRIYTINLVIGDESFDYDVNEDESCLKDGEPVLKLDFYLAYMLRALAKVLMAYANKSIYFPRTKFTNELVWQVKSLLMNSYYTDAQYRLKDTKMRTNLLKVYRSATVSLTRFATLSPAKLKLFKDVRLQCGSATVWYQDDEHFINDHISVELIEIINKEETIRINASKIIYIGKNEEFELDANDNQCNYLLMNDVRRALFMMRTGINSTNTQVH